MIVTPLTGSLSAYHKAQYKNYAAYGLTAKEAESILSEMMKRRGERNGFTSDV